MTQVLLVSADQVDHKMAGAGIRYWEMANALGARGFQVTLAIPNRTNLASDRFALCTHGFNRANMQRVIQTCDVFVIQGYALFYMPFLKQSGKPMVVDIYTPFVFENLEVNVSLSMAERHRVNQRDVHVLQDQLLAGDFFTCASERQRDFWLGMLAALNRVNPQTCAVDRTLRRLIDVVPFALLGTPPQHHHRVLKGVWPGIAESDVVLVWGGGVWEWFDPLTLIKAVQRVVQDCPHVKLLFMGKGHPSAELNDALPMTVYDQAVQLSQDMGLYNRHVFFNQGWIPYHERESYLLEADIGVSTHFDYVENLFSFRTRLLDYVWAGLPMVVSGGDTASQEIVAACQLGRVVPPGDVAALAQAIADLAATPDLKARYQKRFEQVRLQWTWEKAVEPLAAFCQHPQFAADQSRPNSVDL
ncbi:MAG: glycosyltransferase [Anaerolineae bacterium]|nr:glycosyltransferase [Anaerolineae bacterium]